MKKGLLSCLLFSCLALFGENPVFNGSFELGTDGFALERNLRPDTNPKLEFRALAIAPGAPEAGKNSLKIENPYAERFDLYSKEFRLKPNTTYRVSCQMRSSTENSRIMFMVFKIDPRWKAYDKTFKLSKDWKECSFTFTTEKKNGNGYYHFRFVQKDLKAADIFIDDLRITEENAPAADPGIDAVAVSDRNLYQKDEEAKLTLKLFNPTSKTFDGPVTVSVTDEYTKKIFFKTEIPVKLASGEVRQFPLKPLRLNRYGGFRITVSGKGLRNHDGFFAVIGKYEAKPFDITSDAVVGFNAGTELQFPPKSQYPAYHVRNAPLERRFEIFALAGCRILRDHDGGVRGVDWTSVQRNKGKFDFSFLDFQMKLYDKYNITLFPVIGNGHIRKKNSYSSFPEWAKLTKVQPAPPNCMASFRNMIYMPDDQEYGTYIYETAKHLKGRIPVYEIINEPNLYLSPENYIRELKIAHDAIRKADPATKISAFCLTSDYGASATAWMQQSVKLNGLDYADAIGFHPYRGRTLGSLRPADGYIAELRKEMKSYGRGDMPLWNTELYYLADNMDKPSYMQTDLAPHHLATRFLLDHGEGAVQSISIHECSLWKALLTPNALNPFGKFHELVPSENLVAYNALARLFERAKRVEKFRYENGIICYVFRDQHKKLIAAVWNYQGKSGLRADLSGFQVMDLFGNKEKPGMKTLKADPYYLTRGEMSEQEFLEKIKNLKIVLDDPVSAGEFGRLSSNRLFVMLHNSSAKPFTAVIGLNGKGLTADQLVRTKIPARGNVPVEIPVKINDSSVKETVLAIQLNGNMFRKKIRIIRNPMINGTFEGKNFKGSLKFGNGEIRLRVNVQDSTDAGPTGKRNMWETDCVELFFDTDPLFIPERHAQAYTGNTFRIFITPRDGKITASKGIDPAKCRHSVQCGKDSYTVELSIPAKTGKYLGFECKIDDFDSGKKLVGETRIGRGKALHKERCSFVLACEKTETTSAKDPSIPFTLKPASLWKKTADDSAMIEYDGRKAWPQLRIKPDEPLKPNTLYRVSFEAKSTASVPIRFVYTYELDGKKQGRNSEFYPTGDFKQYTFYFNNGETAENGIPGLSFNPTKPFKMEIRNIRFTEMTDDLLFGKNLLPWGDFEKDNSFRPYNKAMGARVKIVDTPDFPSAKKSLLLNCLEGKAEIISTQIPAIPGKEIEVRFFAKSADNTRCYVILDFGRTPKSKHYYRTFNFKPEKEWREFSLRCKVSDNVDLYPVLKQNLTNFRLGGKSAVKGAAPKIYLDGISYTICK